MKQIIVNNISTSYFITEDGKCYNNNTGKYLKGQIGKNGYFFYNLTLPNGKKKREYAHRLVATAYLPNPQDKEQINHIDGNKLNNALDNLEWATQEENQQHAIETELRQFNHIFCFNKNKELVAEYKSVQEASLAAGIIYSIILQEVNKKIKTLSGGFYWSIDKVLGETKNYSNLGKSKEVYQYDLKGKFINKYPSTGAAARSLGLRSSSHIGECCRGKIPTYKGFIWRYVEDIVSPSAETQRDTSEVS
jgi:hypothetical protein